MRVRVEENFGGLIPRFLGLSSVFEELRFKFDILEIRLSFKASDSDSLSISGFCSLKTGGSTSGWSASKSEERPELGVSWDRKDSVPVSIFSSEDGDVNSSSFSRRDFKLLEQEKG